MKKILYSILAAVALFSVVSCQDMLESESNNQLYDPTLSEKTDSVFYAYGVLQSVQQLADQYFFQNELRGDLVSTTKYATTDLRDLANFNADTSNKYDSVYLYYQVINNCNYYLKNRRTDLVTGSQFVVMNEYIAIAAIRAWTYLQLVRNYGDVPYITEPAMSISEINAQQQTTPASTILASEAANLENLKKTYPEYLSVPTYGRTSDVEIGGNGSISKKIWPRLCFFPINLVLGDLYLENGDYTDAVNTYYQYYYSMSEGERQTVSLGERKIMRLTIMDDNIELPGDISNDYPISAILGDNNRWSTIFSSSSAPDDVISYIPMATSMLQGQTTQVPEAFGYLYYDNTGNRYSLMSTSTYETPEVQVEPSDEFKETYIHQPFYYEVFTTDQTKREVSTAPLGDQRFAIVSKGKDPYADRTWTYKPSLGTFYVYRNSTVFLSIAEALNRKGYPDAAFAVLKCGLDRGLKQYVDTLYKDPNDPANQNISIKLPEKEFYFLSLETAKMLSGQDNQGSGINVHFIPQGLEAGGDDNSGLFETGALYGIHMHGAGFVADSNPTLSNGIISKYTYASVVGAKLAQLGEKFPDIQARIDAGTLTKEDTINAVEDLICDEYALETAFEGRRFGDLQRIARHKNESGLYGGTFGNLWLEDKLKFKGFKGEWYLPFK